MVFPDIEPIPKQSVRQGKSKNGKKVFFTPSKIVKYEEVLHLMAKKQYKGEKLTGPIYCKVNYVFTLPKSAPKWQKDNIDQGYVVYKETKPDLTDNIPKPFIDAISSVVMDNDSRIAHSVGIKTYGKKPGIRVEFVELPNPHKF